MYTRSGALWKGEDEQRKYLREIVSDINGDEREDVVNVDQG